MQINKNSIKWDLLGLDSQVVSNLSSVKWKLFNLSKMKKNKHQKGLLFYEYILYKTLPLRYFNLSKEEFIMNSIAFKIEFFPSSVFKSIPQNKLPLALACRLR